MGQFPTSTDGDSFYHEDFLSSDEQGDLATEFNIRSVPTTVIMENGQEVERLIGAQTKRRMVEVLG